MSTEFDLLNDDDDVVHVERKPLCVVLNSTGTRLGVGGGSGFRVFGLRQVSVSDSSEAAGRVQFQELLRFPEPPSASGEPPEEDDYDFGMPSSPVNPNRISAPPSSSPQNCGVGVMALLSETQTVAVVGGGHSPVAPLNTIVIFFGVHRTHEIVLRDAIRRLVMTRWFIIALTQSTVDVVSLRGELLFSAPALGNPVHLGPGPLSLHTSRRFFAFPVLENGVANRSFSMTQPSTPASVHSAFGLKVIGYPSEDFLNSFTPTAQHFETATHIIEAHKNPLSSISLNFDASLVATSSERGTLIRVWTTSDGSLLKELRSASVASPLSQLCFIGNLYIAGQSGSRIKVFFVGEEDKVVDAKTQEVEWWKGHKDLAALAKNQGSRLATLGHLCTYFSSKWAAAEVELPLSKFTPVSMSIQNPSRGSSGPPDAAVATHAASIGRAIGADRVKDAVASTASSWMGYLGTWMGSGGATPSSSSACASTTDALATEPTVGSSDLSEYVPVHLEELCVVWWEHPISKFLLSESTEQQSTTRGRSYSQSQAAHGAARHESSTSSPSSPSLLSDKICYFYCANSDGKLIRLEFDTQQGIIRVIGPSSAIGLGSPKSSS